MSRRFANRVWMGIALLAGRAIAQPESPPAAEPAAAPPGATPSAVFPPLPLVIEDPLFAPLSIQDAILQARTEGKLLVVVSRFMRPPAGRQAWWINPALRAWLKAEAIVVFASPQNYSLAIAIGEDEPGRLNAHAGVSLFIDGQHIALAGNRVTPDDPARGPEYEAENPGDTRPLRPVMRGMTAEWLLGTLDAERELAEARSPVMPFKAAERRLLAGRREVPQPLPPSPDLPTIDEPAVPADAAWLPVLARLREARHAVAAGDPARSLALHTWVWDRAARIEPASSFVTLAITLPEITSLRTQMATAHLARMLEGNPGDSDLSGQGLLQSVSLARVVGVGAAKLDVRRLSDGDRDLLRVASARDIASTAIDDLAPDGAAPWAGRPLDEPLIGTMQNQLRLSRPATVSEPAWERLQSLRRTIIATEMARTFLLAAQKRQDVDANALSRRMLAESRAWPAIDRARAARSLALAALIADRIPPGLKPDLARALADAHSADPAFPTAKLAAEVAALPESRDVKP